MRIAVAVLGCLHLCGGHWGVMQVIAWSNMIVDYSAQDGLIEGAKKTFDGEHPCCMCKAIAEGKKKESGSTPGEKAPTLPQGMAFKDCLFAPAIRVIPPPARDIAVHPMPALDQRAPRLGHRPTLPPPRMSA